MANQTKLYAAFACTLVALGISSVAYAQSAPDSQAEPVTEPVTEPAAEENSQNAMVFTETSAPNKTTKTNVPRGAAPESAYTPPPAPSDDTPWYDYVKLNPYVILRYSLDFNNVSGSTVRILRAGLKTTVNYGAFKAVIDPQIRQLKQRSFNLSNVSFREAYLEYTTPIEGLSIAGGLMWNRIGYFWDDSFYGNTPVIMGMKLDSDYNLQVKYDRNYGSFGIKTWLQASPSGDKTNLTVIPPQKLTKLKGPGDPETAQEKSKFMFSESWAGRLRVEPSFKFGDFAIIPGAGVQYSLIVNENIPKDQENTSHMLVASGDLKLKWRDISLMGEVTGQFLDKELTTKGPKEDIDRVYYTITTTIPVYKQTNTDWLRKVTLTGAYSGTVYKTEDFKELIGRAGVQVEIYKKIKATAEYAMWKLPGAKDAAGKEMDPIFNGIEFILDASF